MWRCLRVWLLLICMFPLAVGCGQKAHNGLRISKGTGLPLEEYTNTIGMRLIWVRPGTFRMGSPPEEAGPPAFKILERQHEVNIPTGFYLGMCEVTNAQFLQFVKEAGYKGGQQGSADLLRHTQDPDLARFSGPDQPVIFVSWFDCRSFCDWLSEKEGCQYRLPTDDEWEYACRGGMEQTYGIATNQEELLNYAWLGPNAGGVSHPVASRRRTHGGSMICRAMCGSGLRPLYCQST